MVPPRQQRGEQRVDEHRHLHRGEPEHGRARAAARCGRSAGCDQSTGGRSGTPSRRSSGSCTSSWPRPPTSTPTASATIGGSMRGAEQQHGGDHPDVEHRGTERRREEAAVRVERAHRERGEADQHQVREHHAA